jgi:hypothetical protein
MAQQSPAKPPPTVAATVTGEETRLIGSETISSPIFYYDEVKIASATLPWEMLVIKL